jgi:hypothetical protein
VDTVTTTRVTKFLVVLGGLVVSVLATGPVVGGFRPGQGLQI